jgi:hypothetical protein
MDFRRMPLSGAMGDVVQNHSLSEFLRHAASDFGDIFFGTLGSGDGKESDATHSILPASVEPRLFRCRLIFDFRAWGLGAFGLGG